MKRILKVGQVILTVLFMLSFGLQGIQPAAALDGGGVRIKRHPQTGKVSFLGAAPGKPINVPGAHAPGLSQKDRALAILQPYAADFGLKQAGKELKLKKADLAKGRQITRFQQTYRDIPVMAGELVVDATDQGGLISINGEIAPDLSLDTKPAISAQRARDTALSQMAKWRKGEPGDFQTSDPELWIYDARLLQPDGTLPMLVWRLDVTRKEKGEPVDELVLVDAQRGGILLHFSQVDSILPPQATELPPTEAPTEAPVAPTEAPTETPVPTEAPTEAPIPMEAPTQMLAPEGDAGTLVAATRYVSTAGTDTGACTNSGSPCATIAYAVTQSTAGDTIKATTGSYASAPQIVINKALTVLGGWNGSYTTQTGFSTLPATGIYVGADSTLERMVLSGGSNGITVWNGIIATVRQSSVKAVEGAGIQNRGTLYLENSTIGENSAEGIYNFNGVDYITNSTIANNHDSGTPSAGGILGGTAYIENTILALNTANGLSSDCSAAVTSLGHNMIGNNCGITLLPSDLLGGYSGVIHYPVQEYYQLVADSPAIDAGDPAACPSLDQRGVARPYGSACDIGAYEYTPPGPPAHLIAHDGSHQIVSVNQTLPSLLMALLTDANSTVINGMDVTFTAPSSGATGTFPGGSHTAVVQTNANGFAFAPDFTANAVTGTYTVVASVEGLGETASFMITNGELYVSPSGADSGNCTDSADPCQTLSHAVDQAWPGNVINAAAGTYTDSGAAVVNINKNLTLKGGWNSTFSTQNGRTIIDGQSARNGISVTGAGTSATLSQLTVQHATNGIVSDTDMGTLNVDRSALLYNSSAGLSNTSGDINITNTTISANITTSGGGWAVYNENGSISINFSTITNNGTAPGLSSWAEGATIQVANSILAGNGLYDCYGHVTSGGHNIFGRSPACYEAMTIQPGDQVGVSPQLSPLTPLGYQPPASGSPAINAAGAPCPATDQRGVSRPEGSSCDIGAVEYATAGPAASITVASGSGQRVGTYRTLPQPLIAYVADSHGSPIAGATVTFTAPSSGPGGTFSGGGTSATATSDSFGLATSPAFITNLGLGTFQVVASTADVAGNASFSITIASLFVAPTGNDSWNCTTPSTPCLTIAAATNKAAAGDTIQVAATTYTGTGSDAVVTLTKGLTLSGGWNSGFTSQDGKTVIDGQGARQGVQDMAAGQTVTISHFTIQNGVGWHGGGIGGQYNTGPLVLEDCIIQDNVATGGGTSVVGGGVSANQLTVTRCSITGNRAYRTDTGTTQGGGIDAQGATITNSLVAYNSVQTPGTGGYAYGGGISAMTLTMTGTSIHHNRVSATGGYAHGGGVYASASGVVNNSSIHHNTAGTGGGGLYLYGDTSVVNNSSIYDNSAGQSGGGLAFYNAATINNSTIVNNDASNGGGIYTQVAWTHALTVKNSIISGNTASNCAGVGTGDHNLADADCTFYSGSGNITGNPKLLPSAIGDPPYYALMAGSAAINAGNPATCLPTDQRGASRPYGAACDVGASEYTGAGTIPAYILIYEGDGQFINPGAIAPLPLKIMAVDAVGRQISGATVTFTAPGSGATLTFSNGLHAIDAVTNADAIANAGAVVASNTKGAYTVQVTLGAVPAASFHLFNGTANIQTYDMNGSSDIDLLPGEPVCDLLDNNCTDGADLDADAAEAYASGTNSFYSEHFGRDSLDGAGMPIILSVHFGNSFDNALWWAGQAIFGDGWSRADDIVAHELTHGVTEHESSLFYYYQSGAIDESLSDIFGELYDQSNGLGNDDADKDWLIGEDLLTHPGGVRRMDDPPAHEYPGPDKMTSAAYDIDTLEEDNGGVHANAGINNKAAYLLVEGDSFNGKDITPLGADKTLAVYYEVNTNLLTSGSDYGDLYYALPQACYNLVGGAGGITLTDCQSVQDAVDATEMNLTPLAGIQYSGEAPDCATENAASNLFFDGFEYGTGAWLTNSPRWTLGSPYGPYARSGLNFMYGDDWPEAIADAQLALKNAVTIPSNAYLRFSHAYDFEHYIGDSNWYDGGVVEYSANNGPWSDAGPLMLPGYGYQGVIYTTSDVQERNPLAGRWAFVGTSHGYTSTRLNLSSLAGKNVKFRWRMGLDKYGWSWGWWLDDVQIYTCQTVALSGNTGGTSGVILNYNDGTPRTVTSDVAGNYSLGVPPGWSGTVTPFKPGYYFWPRSRTYTNVLANLQEQDFTASTDPFDDVPVTGKEWMAPWITAFYSHGITSGCSANPPLYCPEANVTRAEMAVFLLRAKHGAGYQPPAKSHYFSDMPVLGKEWMEPWVDQYYREGLTTGCGMFGDGRHFCPENNVTRAEMAVFVLRALHPAGYQPPSATNPFTDVPVTGKEWMAPWIIDFKNHGITTGCGGGMYCPENNVTRAEMAVFIGRAYNLYP